MRELIATERDGLVLPTGDLDGEILEYERQVDEAVSADEEIAGYVRTLEKRGWAMGVR